jgi:hypothetical protein
MPHDTFGPKCQCGCGEGLPTGSVRKFKRGHAKRFNAAVADAYLAQGEPGFDPTIGINLASPKSDNSPADPAGIPSGNPFENLAGSTPDDPDAVHPETGGTDDTPDIDVPKNVQQDIEGKLSFLLGMSASMMVSVDPICANVFLQQLPSITKAMLPLICQSPDMVAFFTKKGGFILWLNLAAACWPVIQTIFAHHITKKIELGERGEIKERDMSAFRA